MTDLLFVDLVAAVTLVIAAYVPRKRPIVHRLVAQLKRLEDRREVRWWNKQATWEREHPLIAVRREP